MNLKNRTILITGGTRGIGLEMAKQLSQKGNEVVVTGRSSQRVAEVRRQYPHIRSYESDVTQVKDMETLYQQVIREFPKLDVLINNAGVGKTIDFRSFQEGRSHSEEINVNLQGPIAMVETFLPHLLLQKESAIVNVTSALAFSPFPAVPIYSATKAALHSLTQSLRVQLQHTNVKVFELAPPTTRTDMLDGFGQEALKGVKALSVEKLVELAIEGIESGNQEICPGDSKKMKFLSRIAPKLILKKMSGSFLVPKTTGS